MFFVGVRLYEYMHTCLLQGGDRIVFLFLVSLGNDAALKKKTVIDDPLESGFYVL